MSSSSSSRNSMAEAAKQTLICLICHIPFPDENDLKIHQNQVHCYICLICNFQFPNVIKKEFLDENNLKIHQNHNVIYIQCKFCRLHFHDLISCQQHEQMNHNQNSQNVVSYLETPQILVPQPKIDLGNAVAHNFTNNQGQSFSTRVLEGPAYNVTSQSWGPPYTRTEINPENQVAQDFSVQNFTSDVNVSNSIKRSYAEMISTQNPDRSELGSRGLEVSQGPSHQDPSTITELSSNKISINEM